MKQAIILIMNAKPTVQSQKKQTNPNKSIKISELKHQTAVVVLEWEGRGVVTEVKKAKRVELIVI